MIKRTFFHSYLMLQLQMQRFGTLEKERLAQHAQAAMHFMAEITKLNQNIPLLQRLINLKIDNVDKSVFEKKRQLFLGGVPIDRTIFKQSRIIDATNKIPGVNQEIFTFHPTAMVTTPIFNHINQWASDQSMIYGPYGISKTISIMLYHNLSQQINHYLFFASKEERAEFIKRWWDQKKITPPKKIVYWSVQYTDNQSIIDLIQRQCPQLQFEETPNDLQDLIEKFACLYNKNQMSCSVVIDQINQLSSAFQKINYEKIKNHFIQKQRVEGNKKSKSPAKMEKTQVQIQQMEKLINQSVKAKIHYKKIAKLSNLTNGTCFFSSSLNIKDENDDFGKINSQLFTLNLDYHSKMNRFRVPYGVNLAKEQGQNEFDMMLAKEILKILPKNKISELFGGTNHKTNEEQEVNQLRTLKKQITQLRGVQRWPYYSRPLSIRYSLSERQFEAKEVISQQGFLSKVDQIMKKIKDQSKNVLASKMKSFLLKGVNYNHQAWFSIFVYGLVVKKLGDKQIDPNSNVQITHEQIGERFDQLIVDKQVFFQTSKGYRMEVSIRQYEQLLMQALGNIKFFKYYSEMLEDIYKTNRHHFGMMTEKAFLTYLQSNYKGTVIKLKAFKEKTTKVVQLASYGTFKQLKSTEQSITKYFQKMIQICNRNRNKYVFGLPFTNDAQLSSNSNSIDFVFMKIEGETLTILSFIFSNNDFTQSKLNKGFISNKIEEAEKQIKNKSKETALWNRVKRLNWTHWIVANPEWIKENSKFLTHSNYRLVSLRDVIIHVGVMDYRRELFEKAVKIMNLDAEKQP